MADKMWSRFAWSLGLLAAAESRKQAPGESNRWSSVPAAADGSGIFKTIVGGLRQGTRYYYQVPQLQLQPQPQPQPQAQQ